MNIKVWDVCPEEPVSSSDPSTRVVQLATSGYPQLAADTVLNKENQGKSLSVIQNSIRELDRTFRENKPEIRERSIRALLEIALNFLGMERKRVGFSDKESSEVVNEISVALQEWEAMTGIEYSLAVVGQMLKGMKMVLGGKGMVAKMAEEIQMGIDKNDVANSFIVSSRKAIQNNVYYHIVDEGLSKFGNDSATGLRWARHLGAVQVSSNPVIAARAFDEVAELWERFGLVASTHPEWRDDLERYSDEIALFGTVTSLLPNILDFRPIALLSNFEDGMVSIQLNPQKASNIEESLKDALTFYSMLREILEKYDACLMPNVHLNEKTRPNIVFKVSTSGPEAIKLTERLDRMGIGTNNTVTYSVSQEINLTLVAMRGLAAALKSGIPITTIYITNMEGRLEDHLREVQGANFLRAAFDKASDKQFMINSIAQKIGAKDDVAKTGLSLEQSIRTICSKKYLKSLSDDWFVETIGVNESSRLEQLEQDVRMSGIYVTRRVFQILYKPSVKAKLVKYIEDEFQLSNSDATRVVEAVNLLPASKRRAEDTLLVLADQRVSNLTNTEFPDHQLKVLQKSRESGFILSDYVDSISVDPNPASLKRLLEIPDFRKAYQLNAALNDELLKIQLESSTETEGLEPEDWSSYGPVVKTLDEFNGAYLSFRARLRDFVEKSTTGREKVEITTKAKAI